ncbi:hypothetical protein [Halobacterium wangiae]|uniref:hypothetical protein n=1 Tax=Halobacterium wangiae TaxID=2902623 RepID=UPI001E2EAC20|nr:hypothetical protein [Halobacterium wangiae]
MTADSLARYIRSLDVGTLRTIVRYDGDDYEVDFKSAAIEAEYTDDEFEEVAKNFVLKGFDDGHEQPEFARFGHLDATVRWFQQVVVCQIPFDDWSGIFVSFDRESISDTGHLIDDILAFVDEEVHEEFESEDVADQFNQ